jgi:bifunctional non-homologous end joining protein LigD
MASTMSVKVPRPARRSVGARSAMPGAIKPMLSVASDLPLDQSRYAFEFKWDGVRALCFLGGGRLKLHGRSGADITLRYPELAPLADALGDRRAILDGEVVAFDGTGQPSFALLQQRMHLSDARSIQTAKRVVPVVYVIFDLLYLDARSLVNKPLLERRRALDGLALSGSAWQISPSLIGQGTAMLNTARDQQLEGIVAKRIDSRYEPGRRSPAWIKIKLARRQEFVIGGWSTGSGGSGLGALLMGYYDGKQLRYAGKVGSGFSHDQLIAIEDRLAKLKRAESPFVDPVPGAGLAAGRWARESGHVHFVEPRLVAEVEYRRWPQPGLIQQAAFKGLRTDKRASQVGKEA